MPFESKTKYGTQRDNTELILRTLEGIKRVLSRASVGSATLAEQQSQTTLLTTIDTVLDTIKLDTVNLDVALSTVSTEVTLAALLSELMLKADLTETQPVSIASIPIATGAATLVEQQLQTNELVSIAGDVILLSSINNNLNTISSNTSKENWDKIVGNSTEYTYIPSALNPLTDFLVQTIIYKTGVTTMFTRTFVYDADDNVTSITAT